jgi:WD40 repeat protein
LAVAVTRDGRYAVSGSWDCTLGVWDLRGGDEPRFLSGHSDRVFAVAVTPDAHYAVSGSQDRTLRVWNLRTGQCVGIMRTDAVVKCLALTEGPDALLVAGDEIGGVACYALCGLGRDQPDSATSRVGP